MDVVVVLIVLRPITLDGQRAAYADGRSARRIDSTAIGSRLAAGNLAAVQFKFAALTRKVNRTTIGLLALHQLRPHRLLDPVIARRAAVDEVRIDGRHMPLQDDNRTGPPVRALDVPEDRIAHGQIRVRAVHDEKPVARVVHEGDARDRKVTARTDRETGRALGINDDLANARLCGNGLHAREHPWLRQAKTRLHDDDVGSIRMLLEEPVERPVVDGFRPVHVADRHLTVNRRSAVRPVQLAGRHGDAGTVHAARADEARRRFSRDRIRTAVDAELVAGLRRTRTFDCDAVLQPSGQHETFRPICQDARRPRNDVIEHRETGDLDGT